MYPSNDLNNLMEQIMTQLTQGTADLKHEFLRSNNKDNGNNKDKDNKDSKDSKDKKKEDKNNKDIKDGFKLPVLTPQKALVILGLLGGALEVNSVLVDRDQVVLVLLSGSLRRKTRLDKMLDEIGTIPFDEVWQSLLRRGR